ncbi:hypothetical protein ACFLX9_02080 [Chloroflexota bacterium]
MKANLVTILALVLLAAACSGPGAQDVSPTPIPTPTATATPQSTPTPTPQVTDSPTPTALATVVPTATPMTTPIVTPTPTEDLSVPPDRDLFALAQRLVLKSGEPIPRVVNPEPVTYTEGRKDQFNVADLLGRQMYQVTATLQVVSDHAYWYVDDRVSFQMEALKASVKVYEEEIYPRVTRLFGNELVPGVDNDVHLTILHTPLKGLAGYYSSADEYPIQVHPFSNQREMIYIDTSSLPLNSRNYLGTLAHEFTHAIQFRADPTDETWINEGLAEMGKEIAGYTSVFRNSFLASPSTSLTLWPEASAASIPHYGGASLFMGYLAQRYGIESLRLLIEDPADGIQGVEAFLAAVGEGRSFQQVFADWTVANDLDDPMGGIYSYPDRKVQATVSETLQAPGKLADGVPQYGAKYYDLRFENPEVTVDFQGQREIALLPEDPPGGGSCWWGNRGDSIDTTLTGRFTLPSLQSLTLTYSLWYELEEGWDFAYVEVSTDGGITWDILEGKHTSPENPVGNAFGPGYTGSSGGWLQDQVDLTPYRGQEVLVRFEYMTDEAIHGPGLCVDNIAMPAVTFFDDVETDDGVWDTRGFIRTANRVPQSYVLRVIEVGAEPRVRDIPLDENQTATFTIEGLGSRIDHAVIVVAGTADQTTLPAPFQLEVSVPAN